MRVIPVGSLESKYLRMRRVLSFLKCTQEKWSRIHKGLQTYLLPVSGLQSLSQGTLPQKHYMNITK